MGHRFGTARSRRAQEENKRQAVTQGQARSRDLRAIRQNEARRRREEAEQDVEVAEETVPVVLRRDVLVVPAASELLPGVPEPTEMLRSHDSLVVAAQETYGRATSMPTSSNNYSTPLQEYQSIAPILEAFAGTKKLRLWDPFYNDGQAKLYMEAALTSLPGGVEIIHEDVKVNLDELGVLPAFAQGCNMIITNPPFGRQPGIHNVLRYLLSLKLPIMMLVPNDSMSTKRTGTQRKAASMRMIECRGKHGRPVFENGINAKPFPKVCGWWTKGLGLPSGYEDWELGPDFKPPQLSASL